MSEYPGPIDPQSQDPRSGGNAGAQGGYGTPHPYGQPQGGYGQPQSGYGRPANQPDYGGHDVGAGASRAAFDARAITPGGLLAVVGGLLYFLFSFFPWYTVRLWGCDQSYGIPCRVSLDAWDRGSGVFSAMVFVVVTVLFVVKALKIVPATVPLEAIALGAIALGDIFFLIALFATPAGFSRSWALWTELAIVLVINVGGILQFLKAGGAASLRRGLGNMQQRAAGPSGYGQSGPYPPQPPHPQGGHPPQPPGAGGYPPDQGAR